LIDSKVSNGLGDPDPDFQIFFRQGKGTSLDFPNFRHDSTTSTGPKRRDVNVQGLCHFVIPYQSSKKLSELGQ
jgi:hypothetical protein